MQKYNWRYLGFKKSLYTEQPYRDFFFTSLGIIGVFAMAATIIILFLSGAMAEENIAQPDTSSQVVQRWFQELMNHMGGGCCGAADGYPAAIDIEATPEHPGKGHVTDPSGKEIWVGGVMIKKKLRLVGDLTFEFVWDKVTKEKQGNPFDTAYVFVSVNDNGDGTGYIAHNSGVFGAAWNGIYCVAPIPKYY